MRMAPVFATTLRLTLTVKEGPVTHRTNPVLNPGREATVELDELVRRREARTFVTDGNAREMRKQLGLRIWEVAATLHVSRSTVSEWERGTVTPSGDSALRYYDLLVGVASRGAKK